MARLTGLALALLVWFSLAPQALAAGSPFAGWAAVVVAGDWHAHDGGPTETFDNARRDVGHALLAAGFQPQNLREFSVRPWRYRPRPQPSAVDAIWDALAQLSAQAPEGCLVYFTSHGAPSGVVVDDRLMPPGLMAAMLDATCHDRPTVVVISACFSGVFVPALAAPNRMVLTAARPDRSSFGCGASDRYPYFDECFLSAFGGAEDFAELGHKVQACVARREVETHMAPPSQPQLFVGARLAPLLPLYPLGAPAADASIPAQTNGATPSP